MNRIMISGLFVVVLTATIATAQQQPTKAKTDTKDAKIVRALSAAPANIAKGAKVVDRDENGKETVLREGHNGFTCFPGHPWIVDDIAYCANLMLCNGKMTGTHINPNPQTSSRALSTCLPEARIGAQPILTQLREHRSPKGLTG